jgi:DNA modification methylase
MIEINLKKTELKLGDCLEQLRLMPDNSVDSVVTDPPYGVSFMGKKWDHDVPSKEVFAEILRVLKPGGHALIACGTRTQHRMAVNIEDAGFEIRDVITWLYGSGFPKNMDISKAIDKAGGEKQDTQYVPQVSNEVYGHGKGKAAGVDRTPGAKLSGNAITSAAKQWQGWGTALKPACEFWTLARKPLSEKTVAANVLKHGTGGINVDGCRVAGIAAVPFGRQTGEGIAANGNGSTHGKMERTEFIPNPRGRWPANLILDEEAAEVLDGQSGISKSVSSPRNNKPSLNTCMKSGNLGHISRGHADSGGASRFFYVAKASKSERNAGLDDLPLKEVKSYEGGPIVSSDHPETSPGGSKLAQNHHPTVKPVKLMTYLCRLITPPGGIVLDPFMGSGSTGVAAVREGFGFIGIEREPAYFEICKARIQGEIEKGEEK